MSAKLIKPRPCIVCGNDWSHTPFPNKSAICRYCRGKWERSHPDRHWDKKRKCWLIRQLHQIMPEIPDDDLP